MQILLHRISRATKYSSCTVPLALNYSGLRVISAAGNPAVNKTFLHALKFPLKGGTAAFCPIYIHERGSNK
jgi:hypothetical protein